jgi:hypothetical protein
MLRRLASKPPDVPQGWRRYEQEQGNKACYGLPKYARLYQQYGMLSFDTVACNACWMLEKKNVAI